MSLEAGFSKFNINLLTERWMELHKTPNIFAYNLNIRKQKVLPGQFQFYAEYNPERSNLRRTPQTITSLNPQYNDEQFNFNKIDPREHIVSLPFNGSEVSCIINKSPLTMYHTLICPNLKGRLSQRVTLDSLRISVALMKLFDDKAFRIGYNSPGALASVNHLHFHLIHVDKDLYIDRAKLEHLAQMHIFRLSKDMPTEAICWYIYKSDTEVDLDNKLTEIYEFIMWLCEHNRPHNIFMTPTRNDDGPDAIKIFVFARENYCIIKDLQSLNIGFCECTGYVPVGNSDLYDDLTEEAVITKLRNETGTVYNDVYNYFTKITTTTTFN